MQYLQNQAIREEIQVMGHIFCLMGKSASGKDSIYGRLLEDDSLGLMRIVTGTTRPIREGERDGVEYYYYTDAQLEQLKADGKIIECRSYDTVHGIWNYFTVADEHLNPMENDYLTINTLEAYLMLREYFDQHYEKGLLVPLYLEVEDGIRLQRALDREKQQKDPKYKEMCRRFLADEEDFSADKLEQAQIQPVFVNQAIDKTVEDLKQYILTKKHES